MDKMTIHLDIGGIWELSIFFSIVLLLGKLLGLWAMSWWWVAAPVLFAGGVTLVLFVSVIVTLIIKNQAQKHQ